METNDITAAHGDQTDQKTSSVRGYIDRYANHVIVGWVADLEAPMSALPIQMLAGETILRSLNSDLFREDLRNAGHGDGRHGFEIPMDYALLKEIEDAGGVVSFVVEGREEPAFATFDFRDEIAKEEQTQTLYKASLPPPKFKGSVDGVKANTFRGWIMSTDNPQSSVEIELHAGSDLITTITADQHRDDLVNAGVDSTDHGFSLELDYALLKEIEAGGGIVNLIVGDDEKETFAEFDFSDEIAKEARSNALYKASLPPPKFKGSVDGVIANTFRGWVMSTETPEMSVEVELRAGANVIAAFTADQHRDDLVSAGLDSTNHGFVLDITLSLLDTIESEGPVLTLVPKNDPETEIGAYDFSETIEQEKRIGSLKKAAREESHFRGSVDRIHDGKILGWIVDQRDVDRPLNITVKNAGTILGTTSADIMRRDLQSAGLKDGRHGFEFELTKEMLDTIKTDDMILSVHVEDDEEFEIGTQNVNKIVQHYRENKSDSISPISIRGQIDGFKEDNLFGWALDTKALSQRVKLGFYVEDELILTTRANTLREDLKSSGFGDGKHGFSIPFTKNIVDVLKSKGGKLTVQTFDEDPIIIGTYEFDDRLLPETDSLVVSLQTLVFGQVLSFLNLYERLEKGTLNRRRNPEDPIYTTLFEKDGKRTKAADDMPLKLSPYLDFTAKRLKKDRQFDLENSAEDISHYLQWYITTYAQNRGGRIPLSREELEYLNKPITIGGVKHSLSNACWASVIENPEMMGGMRLNDKNSFSAISYWWSIHKTPTLKLEDCLVPNYMADTLRAIPGDFVGQDVPISMFMLQFFRECEAAKGMELKKLVHRNLLTVVLLLLAVERPDYLRYLPDESIKAMFTSHGNQQNLFTKYVTIFSNIEDAFDNISYDDYVTIMKDCGFDLKNASFATFTHDGDRVEAAMLHTPKDETKVDVQVIGPFEKASGLGQATRLSGSAMELTKFDCNFVDFGLDNPAPEGFSNVGALSEFKHAKVNLIHLNAESIPLVMAYAPDVFTGAYNIGYFFWELDTPAECHYLALDILDEVWVSGEYGVEIYQKETKIPVANVGMCFEDLPNLDRNDAREFVESRFRLRGDEFVFLAAFDSFSFVQRKNPLGLLEAFTQAFEGNDNVRLILKTQNRFKVFDPVQARIWNRIEAYVRRDPRIMVMNETLSYQDLLRLKLGSNCYISLHKSEGWGFGMIEAMNLQVPVVCTGYSGNLEFCSDETSWMVDFDEVLLQPDDYIFVRPGQKWADPRLDSAIEQMRNVYNNNTERETKVQRAHQNVQENFSPNAISRRYEERLKTIFSSIE